MPWAKSVRWWNGKTKAPAAAASIASAEGVLVKRGCGVGSPALELNAGNGMLVVNGNITGIQIPVVDGMATLAPDTYDLTLTVTFTDGTAKRLIIGLRVANA